MQSRTRLLLLWLALLPAVAWAQSFLEVLIGTDYASAVAAALVAAGASVIRTGLSLLRREPVFDIWRELLRDTIYAFCAGGIVYIVVEALRQEDIWHPARMTWLLLVVGFGVLRGWIFTWAGETMVSLGTAARERVVGMAKGKDV